MSTNTPAGFSDTEITTAVEQVVLSSIRRPYDTLGVRRTDITFTDVQEAAAGVFLLYRDAPFYILSLSCLRLLEDLLIEAQTISDLLSAIGAIGRVVLPIDDVTQLANARAALLELESAIGARQQAFKNIENVPAFVRYQNNVDQFLGTAGSNVKDNGQIVQTPQEARVVIPGLVSQLQASHTELVRRAVLIQAGIFNFSSLNLPALVAEGVISKSRQVLDARLDVLNAETPEQRLADIRATVLELLTQKGVIKQFGSFSGPSASFSVTGTGQPYSDGTHAASPAANVADIAGPYAIRTGKNILDFFIDAPFAAKVSNYFLVSITAGTNVFEAFFNGPAGFLVIPISIGDVIYVRTGLNAGSRWVVTNVTNTVLTATSDHTVTPDAGVTSMDIWPAPPVSVTLGNSSLAKIEGVVAEPYDIHTTGGGLIDNRTFSFTIDSTPVNVTLGTGSARPVVSVCADINVAIAAQAPGKPVVAEPYFSPLKYDSIVAVTSPVLNTYRFTVLAGALDGLGIVVGDLVQFATGADAPIAIPITAIGPSPIHYVEAFSGVPLLSEIGTNQEILIGPALRRIRLRCSNPATCLGSGTTITLTTDPTNTAFPTTGFFAGATSTSKAVRVRDLIADFNQRTLQVRASSSLASDFTGNVRTDAVFPTKAVVYKFRGTANVVASGLNIVATASSGGLLAAGVQVGDVIALRTGPNPDSIFTVTAVTDTVINATGLVATSTAVGVTIEVGKHFVLAPVAGRTLRIPTGPNSGDYEIGSQGFVPFDFILAGIFPIYKDPITAQFISMTGTLGIESAVFSSVNTTTSSRVRVLGSAADFFYGGGVSSLTFGTSPWFLLPSIPNGLQPGDLINTYATQYNVPSASYVIDSVEPDILVVGIEPEISSNQTWTFSDAIPPPFATVHAGKVLDSSALSTALDNWAGESVNDPNYFIDLNRFINPLLANQNPTAVEVNDARNRLLDLAELLNIVSAQLRSADTTLTLEAILESFTTVSIPAVDVLLKSFSEKGADRALDILLESNFTGFFGLDANSSSYAGNMLQTTRSVAMNDLPMSKINRDDASSGRVLNQADSPNYEFSHDDIETGPQVSPPGGTS